MVAAEIATGIGALKGAYDIAKTLKDITDRVKLNEAIIDLQNRILAAQEEALEARERLRDMQQQIASFENWERTAARYQLKDFGGSTYAYELRAEASDGEPPHKACPRCFESKKRSILHFKLRDASSRDHYKCEVCGTVFELGVRSLPKPPRSTSWDAF